MSFADIRQNTTTTAPVTGGTEPSRLKWTILALIIVMASALGLKAWEERRAADLTVLTSLQGEARAIAGRINGRVDTAETAMRLLDETGTSRASVVKATPGIDAIVSLSDALKAPRGSRLSNAAEAGSRAKENFKRLAISVSGDLVIVASEQSGNTSLAITPAASWMPTVGTGGRLSLSGEETVSIGDASLDPMLQRATRKAPSMVSGEGFSRAATACAPLDGSGVSVCLAKTHPLLSIDDLVQFLIYALLLAAPVLTIFGLMQRISTEETAEIIEATRDTESDRIMSLVMHGARAGYWEWKPESENFFLSESTCAIFGLECNGTVGTTELLAQIHERHRGRMQDAFEKARDIGWIQTSFLTNTQPPRWIEMRGSVSEDDTDGAMIYGGIAMDVTERKRSEGRVKAAERRLRGAVEGFNGPFALWDDRKRILYWNRAFAADFGLKDVLQPGMGQETINIAKASAVNSETVSTEDKSTTVVSLADGRWLKMVERRTPDGGFLTVGVDVSENVRNEQELKRQRQVMRKTMSDLERSEGRAGELARKYSEERSKAEHAANTKSAFLANMSHELRTPLNAINGFSEILAHELYGPLGDDRYKGYAEDILTSGQHLLDMINDILDMAKIEAGKMTIVPQMIDPVDPVDAAVRMIQRKATDKGIELKLEHEDNLPEIDADHRAIRQMVLNLVSNAIKFTDAKGTITVGVQRRGPDIYVGVTDTGIGISEEDLERLATPFEQVSGSRDRNYNGTGLGLALTKSFAEMHGGEMRISSIHGEGTTAAFTLPIAGASAVVARMKAEDDARAEDIVLSA